MTKAEFFRHLDQIIVEVAKRPVYRRGAFIFDDKRLQAEARKARKRLAKPGGGTVVR